MPKRPPFSPFVRSRAASGHGEPKEEFVFGLGNSSLGHVLLATSAAGVVSISIDDDPDHLVEQLETRFHFFFFFPTPDSSTKTATASRSSSASSAPSRSPDHR